MPRGILYLVVGPSGAGKDTLIEEACRQRADLHRARREITRPVNGSYDIEISMDDFTSKKRANAFALTWDAHGFRYGIPREIDARLADGQSVVLSGSRDSVIDARHVFQPLRVIHVTARIDTLSRRLHGRAREDGEAIENRLGRAERAAPTGSDVVTVDNSGSVEDGVAQFLAALT